MTPANVDVVARARAFLADARARSSAPGDVLSELASACGTSVDVLSAAVPALGGARLLSNADVQGLVADFSSLPLSECLERMMLMANQPTGEPLLVLIDPWDDDLVQWVTSRLHRVPLLAAASRAAIRSVLALAEESFRASGRSASAQLGVAMGRPGEQGDAISIRSIETSQSPVVRFVDAVIYDGWKSGASDVHFECDRRGVAVKYRLDGVMIAADRMDDAARAEEVISRIKVLAQLDITERRIPQDGRFRMLMGDRNVDFRVSIMPSIYGEDAVVRLLDKAQLRTGTGQISLERLGFDPVNLELIRGLAEAPHGMLLVTGPTGSGKTTTLYAALSEINSGLEKIVTIEDPVEYELPGVLQIPVNEKKGLTFATGLRSILRHDPDKILVGEIRDPETAEIAVQSALTGHLVFTTVHANSVFDVVGRFLHLGTDLYSVMSALNGVVAQRLVRLTCTHCAARYEPMARECSVVKRILGEYLGYAPTKGRGCERCRNTGYSGRTVVSEVHLIDDGFRDRVVSRVPISEVKEYAYRTGVEPLRVRALKMIVEGVTTYEEVSRVFDLA